MEGKDFLFFLFRSHILILDSFIPLNAHEILKSELLFYEIIISNNTPVAWSL